MLLYLVLTKGNNVPRVYYSYISGRKNIKLNKVEDRQNINLEGMKDCYIYIVAKYNVIVKHRSNTIVLIKANNHSPYDALAFEIKDKTESQDRIWCT